jgi:very-short-patch-repair endonuclease
MVSRDQLLSLGLGRGAIDYWVSSGRLHPRHRGVYAVGHSVIGEEGRLWGALLACGSGAVISHRDAAALWDVRRSSRMPVDVTVPGRSRTRRDGIDIHLVRHLDPLDVTELHGIPVTTLARMFLDLAEVVPQRHVARAMESAERQGLFDLQAIYETAERNPGRHGLKPLLSILTDAVIEPMTRSELEAAFLQLCKQHDIPKPIVNARLGNYEADMLWPQQKLIVELDSRAYHLNVHAFENDRAKDAALQLAGYRVIRITERQLLQHPKQVVATILALLEHASKAA